MKKSNLNTIVTVFLFLIYSITYTIDYVISQSISTTSMIMCIGSLMIFYLFLSRLDSIYYIGIILFTGLSTFLGQSFHLYRTFPMYDLILHLSSGILLVFLGHYFFTRLLKQIQCPSIPIIITVFFCTLFSISSAAVWEIWEFSGDVLFKLNSQLGSLTDTMTDIISGTVGALIGGFILSLILKKHSAKY